jgi:hypothetical protein
VAIIHWDLSSREELERIRDEHKRILNLVEAALAGLTEEQKKAETASSPKIIRRTYGVPPPVPVGGVFLKLPDTFSIADIMSRDITINRDRAKRLLKRWEKSHMIKVVEKGVIGKPNLYAKLPSSKT